MKTSVKVIIGIGTVAALYVAWELFWAWKNNKTEPETADGSDTDNTATAASGTTSTSTSNKTTTTSSTTTTTTTANIVVKYGSKNSYVGRLQRALNSAFDTKLTVDNIYGPKTNAALATLDSNIPSNLTSVKSIYYGKNGSYFTFTKEQVEKTISLLSKLKSDSSPVATNATTPMAASAFRIGMHF